MAEDNTQTTKRTLRGTVVKTAMRDTATVAVTRYVRHPKYKKYIKRVKKYLVHDAGNTRAVGDRILIEECRPISKRKRFCVVSEDVSST